MKEYTLTRCLQATYDALPTHDGDTLYYCKDTGNCYLGSTCLFEKDAFKAVSLNGKIVTFTTHGENGTAGTKTLNLSAFLDADDVVFENHTIMIKKDGSHGTPTSVVKEIVSASPTADGTWDKKGSMTVKRLQGSGCVVWNSLVHNGDFSAWTSGRFLPNSWSNGQYINSTYFNVGRIDGTHGVRLECKANRSGNSYMYCSGHFDTGHTYLFSGWVRNTKTVYIGDIGNNNQRYAVTANTTGRRILGAKKITEGGMRLAIQFAGGVVVGDYAEIDELTIIDLTLMFGEGNEPDANEFTSLFPYNFYSYSAPTLLGNKTNVLRSVGYNLFKDGVALLAGGSYKIEGSYTSLQVRTLRGAVGTPSVDSEGNYTRSTPAYLIVSGWDETTCVHVVGNGSRTGHEDAWTDEITVSVATILCHAEGSQESVTPFPYGLLSIGNVRDEIVTDDNGMVMTAFKRVGVRDHIASDDSDSTVVTDGTHTAYILAEEEIYYLDNPFKAVLKADGWGEEISVPATVSETDNVIASMPCRIVADYKGEAITSIDIDGDERDIHDKRISEADIERWNTPSARPSSSTPQMDGSASSGTEEAFARGDHRHPSDTTKADDNAVVHNTGDETIVGNKTFKGDVTLRSYDNQNVYITVFDSMDGPVIEIANGEDDSPVPLDGIADPTRSTQAANKRYVDSKVGAQPDWEANAGSSSILHKPSIKAGDGDRAIIEGCLHDDAPSNESRCVAVGKFSHAEGEGTCAAGRSSHAEGKNDYAYFGVLTSTGTPLEYSFYDSQGGNQTNVPVGRVIKANNKFARVLSSDFDYFIITVDNDLGELHEEEFFVENGGALGDYSHTEGLGTEANNEGEHAEGRWNQSNCDPQGDDSDNTIHSVGIGTPGRRKNAIEIKKNGDIYIIQVGNYDGTNYYEARSLQSVIESIVNHIVQSDWEQDTPSAKDYIKNKPSIRKGAGWASIVEGTTNNLAIGDCSHAEGVDTISHGEGSHAEGRSDICNSQGDTLTIVSGETCKYTYSGLQFDFGVGDVICYNNVWAEVVALDYDTNVVELNRSLGNISNAEFERFPGGAFGDYSHVEGEYTVATNENEHAQGICNLSHCSANGAQSTLSSIGIGFVRDRKNAQEVMRNGDMYIIGIGGYDGTNATSPNAKTLQEAIGRGIGTAPLINVSIALTQNDVTTIREWTYTSDGPSFVSAVVNFLRAGTFNNTNRVGVVLVYSTDGGTTWERLSEGFCSMASNYGMVSLNGIVPSGGTVNVKMEAYTPSTDVIVPSVTQFYNNFYMRGVTMSVIGFNSASTIQVT